MKKLALSTLLCLSISSLLAAPSGKITEEPAIIPAPLKKKIELDKPGFSLSNKIRPLLSIINRSQSGEKEYEYFQEILSNGGQITLAASPDEAHSESYITFSLRPELGEEGYKIDVSPVHILVYAGGRAGAFYAAQTLIQSICLDENKKPAIPTMNIEDKPRFKWRGLMVDSGRNPRTVEEIKKIIDILSRYKFNVMHWHLTDDQGWRIEIKKYPKLTAIGATRSSTPLLGARNKDDNKPFSFYYTQEQIKDVVKYAKDRCITVVPEIEVPGHASAAVTAYPELGNKDIPDYKPSVVIRWGVFPYIFSPSEETFKFLDDVFTEVVELFPGSPYIHIGGDEAPKSQWKISPLAQKVMKKNNLKNEEELQSYFIKRVEKMVNAKGKRIIGWDEIQEGGLSKTATMMVWRDWKWAKHALENGNEIIMTPTSHCYLDYKQGPHPEGPEFDMIGGNVPLEKVYSLNPIPEGVTDEQKKRIIGVQGNCWSEYIQTMPKWEYMIIPRALAMSEVAWSMPENKNFDNFKQRWDKHKVFLDKMKVNYRKDDGTPAIPAAKLARD